MTMANSLHVIDLDGNHLAAIVSAELKTPTGGLAAIPGDTAQLLRS
jgi:hypothetical protein